MLDKGPSTQMAQGTVMSALSIHTVVVGLKCVVQVNFVEKYVSGWHYLNYLLPVICFIFLYKKSHHIDIASFFPTHHHKSKKFDKNYVRSY